MPTVELSARLGSQHRHKQPGFLTWARLSEGKQLLQALMKSGDRK
jgi:hypothetical protein